MLAGLVALIACRRTTDLASPIAPLPFEVVAAVVEPAAPIDPRPRQRVDVRYDADADAWDVTWTFVEPTPGILFDRRNPRFRHGGWTPGPGLRWSIERDDEVLRPLDGVERTSFAVRFATDDTSRLRAPPLHFRWRDGGRLLFTGSLGVHALRCADERCDRRDVGTERSWELSASDGRGLRILDASGRGALRWAEPAGELRGTYLYAGDQPAVEAGGAITITDAGIPAWLAAETARHLTPLLASYAARTGLALPFRPLVLISRGARTGRGRGVRGRTLPALMQLEADGGGWDRQSRAAQRQWFELLAHEAFHFWNSQVARRADVRDEWWSEGASSYVAGLALRDAGFLDERRYTWRVLRAANACLATLRGPLHDEGAEASYYTCGELIHFVVDRRLAATGGVFPIYAALFADAQVRGTYTTADFVALVTAADAALAADLTPILERGLGAAPAARVQRLLADAGVATRATAATRLQLVRSATVTP